MNLKYKLKDIPEPTKDIKVFSLFAGGGGSSIGYKLNSFNVLGGLEIDPKQANLYLKNLKPKYFYTEDIRDFKHRADLPKELYQLDILDASPPCSLFSSANLKAEERKGKKVSFAEGRVEQVLDDLFFEAIEVIAKLQPKIAIMENVKGLLSKKNKFYVEEIYKRLNDLGYFVKHFIVNSADYGVPQKRVRVFFIASKNKNIKSFLPYPTTDKHITIGEIDNDYKGASNSLFVHNLMKKYKIGDKNLGDIRKRVDGKSTGFNSYIIKDSDVCNTIRAGSNDFIRVEHNNIKLSNYELIQIQTFPLDYNFYSTRPIYTLGMSVPPFLMKELSKQVVNKLLVI